MCWVRIPTENWHKNKKWHSKFKVNFVSQKWLHMVLVDLGKPSQLMTPHTGNWVLNIHMWDISLASEISWLFIQKRYMHPVSLEVSLRMERLWGFGDFAASSKSLPYRPLLRHLCIRDTLPTSEGCTYYVFNVFCN